MFQLVNVFCRELPCEHLPLTVSLKYTNYKAFFFVICLSNINFIKQMHAYLTQLLQEPKNSKYANNDTIVLLCLIQLALMLVCLNLSIT